MQIKILSWNINGVKNKLQNDDVKDLINQYDILILSETHFSQRIKCPDDFTFICRSEQVLSKKPRGGVHSSHPPHGDGGDTDLFDPSGPAGNFEKLNNSWDFDL